MGSLKNYVFACGEDQVLTESVQRFRNNLFVRHLGWKLTSIDSCERDEFDNDKAIYSALLDGTRILASFRAIRTDHDYLAANIFPQLATVKKYPRRRNAWEISRFGALPSRHYLQTAALLYGLMFKFALDRHAKTLVAVTDPTQREIAAAHLN